MLSKRKKSMIVITAVIAFLITAIGIIYHYTKRSYVDPIVTEVTIESDKVSAPIKSFSNPVKQVAFLPFSKPLCPRIEGAAQIAPIKRLCSAA